MWTYGAAIIMKVTTVHVGNTVCLGTVSLHKQNLN